MNKNAVAHVFVYGTLKVAYGNSRITEGLRDDEIVEGTIPGAMYHLGGFPGIRLDEEGTIRGEVHSFNEEHWTEALRRMDGLEGYQEGREDNFYNRKVVNVATPEGEIEAYVYEFGRTIEADRLIPDGDWQGPQTKTTADPSDE